MSQKALEIRDNENGPRRCVNTAEGLTHSSGTSREGLGVKPTRTRAVDITGQRFSSLVVIARAGSSSAGNATWTCLCDCGNTTTSAGSDLRRGRTSTCGHAAAESTRKRHAAGRDLVGRRFGRLTVTEFAGLNDYPRATWRCVCDCGNHVVVTGHHLKEGQTVSCGCGAADPRPGAIREEVTYGSAHQRVKRLHGVASEHLCVDCFKAAVDWSYDHEDEDERVDIAGRAYSMKPEHYWPRCRSCHKFFDLDAAGASGEVATEGEVS